MRWSDAKGARIPAGGQTSIVRRTDHHRCVQIECGHSMAEWLDRVMRSRSHAIFRHSPSIVLGNTYESSMTGLNS